MVKANNPRDAVFSIAVIQDDVVVVQIILAAARAAYRTVAIVINKLIDIDSWIVISLTMHKVMAPLAKQLKVVESFMIFSDISKMVHGMALIALAAFANTARSLPHCLPEKSPLA